MSAVDDVLGQLRGERESLAVRLAALDNLIPQLERYVGAYGRTESVSATPEARGSTRPGVAPPTGPPSAVNRDDQRTQKILACLKTGPKATREIAAALSADRLVVKQALQRLKKAKVIASTGATNSQRWALPTTSAKSPAAPALALSGTSDGPLCVRCHHRFAAHDPTNGNCLTDRCVCKEFYA